MDFDLGESAAALRVRLRELIATHIADDYLGAFTSDPADLDVAQRFCKTLADEGLLTLAWPTEYGGGGGSVWDQTVVREEMWAHHRLVPHRASATAVLRRPGEGEQSLVSERLAEPLGDVEVGGVTRERAEVVLGDVRGDQVPQPGPQGGGRLAEIEVHGVPDVGPRKSDTNVSRVACW